MAVLAEVKKPNILFIIADDQSPFDFKAYNPTSPLDAPIIGSLAAKGMTIESATIEAAKLRFRPIIMTTASTIFGALPLAFASGPGAEAREQIGWVVVGGMGLGTLLTLFVLPSIFIWVNKCVMWFSIRKQLD